MIVDKISKAILWTSSVASVLICSAASAQRSASVADFGAVADAKTDCTASFHRALSAMEQRGGGIVEVPAGQYLIAGTLDIPAGVTLEGTLTAPPSTPRGSVLLTTQGKGRETGAPFITLRESAAVKGLSVVYPEQSKQKPTPYPWCIQGAGDNCSVVDCLLLNPWQAVDFGTNPCGRHYIHGLNAQPIRRGIYIDRCYDIGRIENVHLWPFWTVGDKEGPWLEITKKEGEGFIFGRSDWEYVSNSFVIAYGTGIHFIRSKDTSIGGGNYLLSQTGADMSPIAVLVDETQDHSGISFSNSQLFGDLVVKPQNNGMVRFTGCGLFGSLHGNSGTAQALLSGRGRVSFDNCTFHCIEPANKGSVLIVADAGRVSIVGCQFITSEFTLHNPVQISLGRNVVSAIITSNEFNGEMRIINQALGQVRIADNTTGTEAVYNALIEKRGQLPLSTVVPGTEVTQPVINHSFTVSEAGKPKGWEISGDIGTAKAVGVLPAEWKQQAVAALAWPGKHGYPASTLIQAVKLKPDMEYVLSGYIWNMAAEGQVVAANVDIGLDTPGYLRLAVLPGMPGANKGYFVYGKFSTTKTGTKTVVRVFYDGMSRETHFAADVAAAQWSHICVTEASKFHAPKRRGAAH